VIIVKISEKTLLVICIKTVYRKNKISFCKIQKKALLVTIDSNKEEIQKIWPKKKV